MSTAPSPAARPEEAWKCGLVRDVLYTHIWNCGIGMAFWAIGALFRPRGLELDDLAGT